VKRMAASLDRSYDGTSEPDDPAHQRAVIRTHVALRLNDDGEAG